MNYANNRVRANEGEGGGFVGSYVSSGDQKSGGGGKAATAAVEVPEEQVLFRVSFFYFLLSRLITLNILTLTSRC